jgi:hypothetical protein
MELLGKKKNTGNSATQRYVDVEEIRDGVVVLKNGSIRAVLLVSSINFDLKSSMEQEAIIAQYQNFLNAIDFPVQMLVQSRRYNIDPYLELLRQARDQQTNELLRSQTQEYMQFVQGLTQVTNIMSKYFYVIVPFAPGESKNDGIVDKVLGIFTPKTATNMRSDLFELYKQQLLQRVAIAANALSATGVRTALLGTEEVIELLYQSYNPSLFANSLIRNTSDVELQTRFES